MVALPYFEYAELRGRVRQTEYIVQRLMAAGVPGAALGKMS